jgi:hypothetical protein
MKPQSLVLAVALAGSAYAQTTEPVAADSKEKSTAAAPANDSKPAAEKKSLDPQTADLAELQAAGYRVQKRNGETLYCRKDPETGSRVRTNTFCLTREQLTQIEANTRDSMRALTKDNSPKGN